MTTAERAARAAAERLKGRETYGIPLEALQKYDLGRGMRSALDGSGGFEAEVSVQVARSMGIDDGPGSLVVPGAAFFGSLGVGQPGAGQELVLPEQQGPFIDGPPRSAPRVFQLGASVLDGPGDLRMVGLADGFTIDWIPNEDLEEHSETDFETLRMRSSVAKMKTGLTGTIASRQLMAQSDVGPLLRRDADVAVASLVDHAAVAATGEDGEPRGLFHQDMSLAPALGPNGGAIDYATLTAMEHLADENTIRPGWLTTSAVRRELRGLPEVGAGAGPVWRGGPAPGSVLGAPAFVSGHVPSTLTKGSGSGLHGMIYSSDWTSLVVRIGAVHFLLDEFTLGAKGWIIVRIFLFAAIGLWRDEPFVRCGEILVPGNGGS